MKIGVDLGGSHIAVGVVSENGKILAQIEENILFIEQKDIKELIRDKTISLINLAINKLQIPIFTIEKIGIVIPGIVENNKIKSCMKYGIEEWDLAKELKGIFNINVQLVNDAYASAKCEKEYGALKDSNKSVFMCIGTGIGGATILESNIFPSEFGHMVIQKDGKKCYCGKKGCFELYASMYVFKKDLIELLGLNSKTTSEELQKILENEKDNITISKYIDEYIEHLLIGISNIVNIIAPEKICIGGSFTYFKNSLYYKLIEKSKTYKYQFQVPKIVLAEYGNDSGIIGAAM